MSASGIQPLLAQMESMAAQAANQSPIRNIDNPSEKTGFADSLVSALERVNTMKNAATTQSRAFQAGAPGIELHNVMVDNQKAGLAFEMTVQVRNKLVSAYRDIMNMQV